MENQTSLSTKSPEKISLLDTILSQILIEDFSHSPSNKGWSISNSIDYGQYLDKIKRELIEENMKQRDEMIRENDEEMKQKLERDLEGKIDE